MRVSEDGVAVEYANVSPRNGHVVGWGRAWEWMNGWMQSVVARGAQRSNTNMAGANMQNIEPGTRT